WVSCTAGGDDVVVIPAANSSPETVNAAPPEPFDPVCHMEVNPRWGYAARFHDKTYAFCTLACRDRFVADPERFLSPHCLVCESPIEPAAAFAATYLGKTYHLCSSKGTRRRRRPRLKSGARNRIRRRSPMRESTS